MFKKNPKKSVLTLLLLALLTLVLVLSSASLGFAQDGGFTATGDISGNSIESEFTNSKTATAGRVEIGDLEEVNVIITIDETIDAGALKDALGAYGEVTYEYSRIFNGVALSRVAGANIDAIASMSGVVGIYLDEEVELTTDAGPQWIGAPAMWSELGGQENAGEGVIVGILDSGVWPENPSFADPDPNGNPYPAPPGTYGCDLGSVMVDGTDLGLDFECNNKLIGAYRFMETFEANRTMMDGEFLSARDNDGHGSHTASTAAGNSNVSADLLGGSLGILSGVAPRAQIIAYKVCGSVPGTASCFGSDTVAAVEQAIIDGVDVLNFSVGGGSDPYNDIVSLAFLSAYDNGIFVAKSAGNSGPGADTVAGRSPWVTTVGASTHDRGFVANIELTADGGAALTLDGVSITAGFGPAPVVLADDFDGLDETDAENGMCNTPFPAGTFNGEIVVCKRGVIARVTKSANVAAGGAGGFVLYNPALQTLNNDSHWVPAIHIQDTEGVELLDFMANNTNVMGTLSGGIKTTVQGDVMAAFSSRGGSGQTLGVSKPDVTGPGVNILAAITPYEAEPLGQPSLFGFKSGTSMSSPHTAGSAALLKALHPDWTPGQIKSALMTTATVDGVTKEDGVTPVDHFDVGSGRIDLNYAGNPGLTISDSAANYVAHEDDLWNSNYPSLYIPSMPGEMTVYRTLQSELDYDAWWYVSIESDEGLVVDTPSVVPIRAGRDRTIPITVDASGIGLGETAMAVMHLTHGDHALRFPITIVREQALVSIDKSCDSASLAPGEATECTVTVTNNSFASEANFDLSDILPRRLRLVNGSVDGATQTGSRSWSTSGSLFAASPPVVDAAVDPTASPAGYLPLALFSSTDLGATDESIVNVTVPAFEYAGETWSTIGVVSNGYIVVGGGTGADVQFTNTTAFPDDSIPNNVLAPFWTDLDPSAGGRVLVTTLTDGINSWIVVEWEMVPNFGDGEINTFQVWIGYGSDEDISFTYGPADQLSDGDGGLLTVGAENMFGNTGTAIYQDGVGDLPAPSFPDGDYEIDVFSAPGAPGGSHTVTFSMYGTKTGDWTNCAEMTSDLFEGTAVSCFSGEITSGAE
ncbi:S8 family serine peptidase [Candidatus Leptofilum sp.]|uniref:S8 family serine peptidase n=1 Tax=Candidatus Leptofilum sp. TaxID=3241576 RepID=UPI003B590678